MQTPVVFRVDRGGEVFALFPALLADPSGNVTSHQHIGQHGAADYVFCIAKSIPATPAQYAALLDELTGRGYSLRVVRRQSPAMCAARG